MTESDPNNLDNAVNNEQQSQIDPTRSDNNEPSNPAGSSEHGLDSGVKDVEGVHNLGHDGFVWTEN